jgi:hypothetical protein
LGVGRVRLICKVELNGLVPHERPSSARPSLGMVVDWY